MYSLTRIVLKVLQNARQKFIRSHMKKHWRQWYRQWLQESTRRWLIHWLYTARNARRQRVKLASLKSTWVKITRLKISRCLTRSLEVWKKATERPRGHMVGIRSRQLEKHFVVWYGMLWASRAERLSRYRRLAVQLSETFTRWCRIARSRAEIKRITWARPKERKRVLNAWRTLRRATYFSERTTIQKYFKVFRLRHRKKVYDKLKGQRTTGEVRIMLLRKFWKAIREHLVARRIVLRRTFKLYRTKVFTRKLMRARRSAIKRMRMRKCFLSMRHLFVAVLSDRLRITQSEQGWDKMEVLTEQL